MKLTNKLAQVELKKGEEAVTGKMGLSWLVGGMRHFGVLGMISEEYGSKKSSNREIDAGRKIMTGMMLKVSGGSRVEDVEVLRKDVGLMEALGWDEMICGDTLLRFMGDRRRNGRNRKVNERMIEKALRLVEDTELTYDNDATQIDSDKESAEYSYEGRRQFSVLMGCIAETGLINTVEYRRGNASPQTGILNQLRKACRQAEAAGKRIKRFRSDSAGYQDKILSYCDAKGIEYYVSVDKNEKVRKTIKRIKRGDWKTMYGAYKERHDTQWAQTEYVVWRGYRIRLLVLRWKNPDPTLFDASPYCYHVIGTNNWEIDPMAWLEVHNGRMGSIEGMHKELKSGYGCGYTPSHDFEKNRGYFLLGVLAHNMVQIMKLFYLGKAAADWTIKTMRYRFIDVCGKIVKSGRRFTCKIINVCDEVFELFRRCHERLKMTV